jgi:predicted AAA+ superfamily ATPase
MSDGKYKYFLTGEALAQLIARLTSGENGKFKQRDFVTPLFNYCTDNLFNGTIGMVYGLRSTGKTVGMLQVAERLTELGKKVAYARFNYEEVGLDAANAELKALIALGCTHFFVDEATYIGGFLNMSAEWPDLLVPMNQIKIVVTGTDSFLLWVAGTSSLFHRNAKFSTNFMSYAEYKRVFSGSFEEFKTSGGIFPREDMNEFIQSAVVMNLLHTIDNCDEAGYGFSNIYVSRLFGLQPDVIFKAVISILKCAVMPSIKNHFVKFAETENLPDLGMAIAKWMPNEKREFKARIADSLSVYQDFVKVESPELVIEALIEFLVKVGCLTESFVSPSGYAVGQKLYYFSHNALMYYATQETVNTIYELPGIETEAFAESIARAQQGFINESVVFSHVVMAAKKAVNDRRKAFQYRDGKGREIDVVVCDRETNTLFLIEVKSKKAIHDASVFVDEARHLYDAAVLKNIGADEYGQVKRIIVYQGENRLIPHKEGDLHLANIEDFLINWLL